MRAVECRAAIVFTAAERAVALPEKACHVSRHILALPPHVFRTGWLDASGAENGDKCAWISSGVGATQNVSFSTGTFAVQSLWSNKTTNCAIHFP